jgi:hypothetical protein
MQNKGEKYLCFLTSILCFKLFVSVFILIQIILYDLSKENTSSIF